MTAAAVTTTRAPRAIEGLVDEQQGTTKVESPRELATRRLKENTVFKVALVTFVVMVVMCMSAPFFAANWAGRGAYEQNLSGNVDIGKGKEAVDLHGVPNIGPGLRTQYTFGSDHLGRDVFIRVLEGGRVSLTIAFGATMIVMILGTLMGTAAGFYKGRLDQVISRYFDFMLAFPSLLLMIALSTALATREGWWIFTRGSIGLPIVVIGFTGMSTLGRIIRSQAYGLAEREYVEAARALGATNGRIMLQHMLPSLLPTLVTWAGLLLGTVLLAEAGLSFLGVGVLPPIPSWGNIIADGRNFYSTAWWVSFFPGLFIALTVLSLNLIGQALEEALDPKALEGR